ncbi:MAG: hypothetical protein LBV33_07860 [Lachnospiraceae bacterium]|jgi:hypothetical protein|nr:hypothetical protein [Lachnospiraceae bacterium]
MINQLTESQFLDTFIGEMTDITETVKVTTDIWAYAAELLPLGILSDQAFEKQLIESVYANSTGSYHHILLFGPSPNNYVAIIVDVNKCSILGHHLLDINGIYSI